MSSKTEKLKFEFYLLLINLKLNSHTGLVSIMMNNTTM